MVSGFSSFFRQDKEEEEQHRLLQRNKSKMCTTDGLDNIDFNQAIRRMTPFTTAQASRSLLNDTDTPLVARCSSNWWAVTEGTGIAAVTCDEYEAQDCANNQDLPFETGEVHCLEPSSMPSESPSATPSSSPSESPSSNPTESPSDIPSVSSAPSESSAPTYSPTLSPTYDD